MEGFVAAAADPSCRLATLGQVDAKAEGGRGDGHVGRLTTRRSGERIPPCSYPTSIRLGALTERPSVPGGTV